MLAKDSTALPETRYAVSNIGMAPPSQESQNDLGLKAHQRTVYETIEGKMVTKILTSLRSGARTCENSTYRGYV
jgi:hypothetical protein